MGRERRRLPPLPAEIHTPAGPFRVLRVPDLRGEDGEKCEGETDWPSRTIRVEAALHPVSAWLILRHEWVHAVLYDAGVTLPKRARYEDDPEEAVANTIAQALVAEMRGVSV